MTDEQYLIDCDFGNNRGRVRIKDHSRLEEWVEQEADRWKWLIDLGDGDDRSNVSTHVSNVFDSLRNHVHRVQNGQTSEQKAVSNFVNHFVRSQNNLWYSGGATGSAILAIKREVGDEDAALAYALASKIVPADPADSRHFRLLSLIALPRQIGRDARAAAAQESYRAILNDGKRLLSEQNDLLEKIEADWTSQLERVESQTRASFRKAIRNYVKSRRKSRANVRESIASIKATEIAFAEKMRLKASVDYWQDKFKSHDENEATSRKVLLYYIVGGVFLSVLAFGFGIVLMLEMAGTDAVDWLKIDGPNGRSLPATPFIVVAAGLGTVLTAVFWAARILIRNYLTERHLKRDAKERMVMTMTYLALIEEGAIQEEERLVILNALFRPAGSADHVESSYDIAIPALMAKLVDQRSSSN